MVGQSNGNGVSYRTLLSDPALVIVFLISGSTVFGSTAVPVALPVIGATFALSETEIGLIMTAFYATGIIGIPLGSIAADVIGRRAVVIPSLIMFGVAGLATLAVNSYPALLALRVIQGIALIGTIPLTATLTADLYTGAEGASAQGIRSGINGIVAAISPVIAGGLAALAWQYPFALFGLTLPVAAIVYGYFPETTQSGHTGRNRLGRDLREYFAEILAVVERRLGVYLIGGGMLFFLKGGVKTFLPVLAVTELETSVMTAGILLGVYAATRVVVSPFAGSVQVRLDRKLTLILGTTLAAIGIGMMPFVPTLSGLFGATVIFGMGESVLNPVLNDAVASLAATDHRAGVMSGLQVLKQLSLTISPALFGAVIGFANYGSAFLLAGALAVGYVVLVVFSW